MLQALVQESAVGIAIIDRHGLIVRVNDALHRMVDHGCDLSAGQSAQNIFCTDCPARSVGGARASSGRPAAATGFRQHAPW